MTLAAAQVIDAHAARLMGLPLAGTRVYTSRLWPLAESELPAWRVTAGSEDVEVAMADGTNQHTLEVVASGYVRATDNLDDALHALAAEGLTALCALPALYGAQLTSIERDMTTEGEAAMGVIRLSLLTRYFVAPSAPETIL